MILSAGFIGLGGQQRRGDAPAGPVEAPVLLSEPDPVAIVIGASVTIPLADHVGGSVEGWRQRAGSVMLPEGRALDWRAGTLAGTGLVANVRVKSVTPTNATMGAGTWYAASSGKTLTITAPDGSTFDWEARV